MFDYFKGKVVPGYCPDEETYPEEEYPCEEEGCPDGETYPEEEY